MIIELLKKKFKNGLFQKNLILANSNSRKIMLMPQSGRLKNIKNNLFMRQITQLIRKEYFRK